MNPFNPLLNNPGYMDDLDLQDFPVDNRHHKYRAPQKRDTRHTYKVKVNINTPDESRLVVTTQKARNKYMIERELQIQYSHYKRNEVSWTITKV